ASVAAGAALLVRDPARRRAESGLFPYTTLCRAVEQAQLRRWRDRAGGRCSARARRRPGHRAQRARPALHRGDERGREPLATMSRDRKSTRLNSSHVKISYAAFWLKKKREHRRCP